MNILFVYPTYPDTFWSFKHALRFVSKKAANPPLGLLTISSLLPKEWNKKLVDLNIEKLKKKDLYWADYVYISAMSAQKQSAIEIINQCKVLNKNIIAGGPLFTAEPEYFGDIDHLILNEAEITLVEFLEDFENLEPEPLYETTCFADIKKSPVPDYSLIKASKYNSLCIQYSRGCPFDCEFCDITALFGRKSRVKTAEQVIQELENLLSIGWKGDVFFVDDNFIGNKNLLKIDLLPKLIDWMQANGHPFTFSTEASINLADDQELMDMMVKAGFAAVFVGIETIDEKALEECNKVQNKNRNLVKSVHIIQQTGMEVLGGFIVGFDNDPSSIFQKQLDFIKESKIVSAMVGLLNAQKKSRLYKRLKEEGRIIMDSSGNNTDYSLNFIPKMDRQTLLDGYSKLVHNIYEGKAFHERAMQFLKDYSPGAKQKTKVTFTKFMALVRSIFIIGIFDKSRRYYWKLFIWCLFKRPKVFPLAITYSIYGYHYRKVYKNVA